LAYSILEADDGGFIVGGNSSSDDGDVIGNNEPGADFWFVKLNSSGELYRLRCFGSDENSVSGRSVCQATDGGFVMVGFYTYPGANTANNWVVKLLPE
jgi:hypothetical protein